MESSPARQKSVPQATVAAQRNVLRGGLVGVDLNSAGRPDLIVAGLDLITDPLHASMHCAVPSAQTQVAGHIGMAGMPISGHGPGGTVIPPGNMMSPSVPMMPLHISGSSGNAAGQPGMMSPPNAGSLMWPSPMQGAPSTFAPLAPGGPFLQPPA